MVLRGNKLTGKQPAAIELTRRDHSIYTRLCHRYIGMSELR